MSDKLTYIKEKLNNNKKVYVITSDLNKAKKNFAEFTSNSNFSILDTTDICIEVNFKKDDIVVIDDKDKVLTTLLNHEINYY